MDLLLGRAEEFHFRESFCSATTSADIHNGWVVPESDLGDEVGWREGGKEGGRGKGDMERELLTTNCILQGELTYTLLPTHILSLSNLNFLLNRSSW